MSKILLRLGILTILQKASPATQQPTALENNLLPFFPSTEANCQGKKLFCLP